MPRVTVRWIFAVLAIICGVYILAKAGGNNTVIAAGLGVIFAGVGLVTP